MQEEAVKPANLHHCVSWLFVRTPPSVWPLLVTSCRPRPSRAMEACSGGACWTGSSRSSRTVRRWGSARCRSGCVTSRSSATSSTTSKWVASHFLLRCFKLHHLIILSQDYRAASLTSLDQSVWNTAWMCFLLALTLGYFWLYLVFSIEMIFLELLTTTNTFHLPLLSLLKCKILNVLCV